MTKTGAGTALSATLSQDHAVEALYETIGADPVQGWPWAVPVQAALFGGAGAILGWLARDVWRRSRSAG